MINNLKIKIFSDGANLQDIEAMSKLNYISGLTTNPTLMKAEGIKDYEGFSKEALKIVNNKPISFEVFADDLETIYKQAKVISSWGKNVFVKLPITNTKREFIGEVAKKLSNEGVKINVTAILSTEQVENISKSLNPEVESIISVFAGRIADTGIDPIPVMKEASNILKSNPKSELLWASPREILNIYQADHIGCHIITVTPDVLKKLNLYGKDLNEYSLETVKMFYKDAKESNFTINL